MRADEHVDVGLDPVEMGIEEDPLRDARAIAQRRELPVLEGQPANLIVPAAVPSLAVVIMIVQVHHTDPEQGDQQVLYIDDGADVGGYGEEAKICSALVSPLLWPAGSRN